jgi:hypothetical protein
MDVHSPKYGTIGLDPSLTGILTMTIDVIDVTDNLWLIGYYRRLLTYFGHYQNPLFNQPVQRRDDRRF